MKSYFFKVTVYKRVKADNFVTAKSLIEKKTNHFNDCRKFELISEEEL